MKILTIGFTNKSAETRPPEQRLSACGLYEKGRSSVHNKNHLQHRLRAFSRTRAHGRHSLSLQGGEWPLYESQFLDLMRSRRIENTPREILDAACLLCGEETPHHCHGRLVAEYLRQHWRDVEIEHIP
jgi:hypothetical protein